MSTDLAPTEPTHQAIAVKTRSKPGRVTGKLADAINRMIDLGERWDDAARAVGLSARTMRKALERPHVVAHLRTQKQVFREAACTANIKRLCEIRDAANNMPAVQAIKALEQLGDDPQANAQRSQSPGIVIVIGAPAPPAVQQQGQVIDLTADGEK